MSALRPVMGIKLQSKIKRAIRFRAVKLLKKRTAIEAKAAEYRKKFSKRTGLPAGLPKPKTYPVLDNQFEPIYCLKRSSQIARGIWRSSLRKKYTAKAALLHRIPKPGALQKREIMEFSVPDAAFATVLNNLLLKRNLKRFSGNPFAYRPDRNQFDAIINLKQYLRSDKIFVIQFDFKNYFDTIPHAYIKRLLDNYGIISISEAEKRVIDAFLIHKFATRKKYILGSFSQKKEIGTPQGSSVSLFLANLANDALAKRIEGVNGQFVRYADDVVAIANTYEDAIKIEQCFHEHCNDTGLEINFEKSDGIRLLSQKAQNEISTIQKFKFLGYDFSQKGCAISDKAIEKIKSKISRLIQIYLIQYVHKHNFNHNRTLPSSSLPFFDWDLMGLVSEIRNYLYGGCSEDLIYSLLSEGKRIPPMRGLMSFYALVDSKDELMTLDGWMVNTLRCALNKRRLIFSGKYSVIYPRFSNKSLILGSWYDPAWNKTKFIPDPRLPSFVRGWRAAQKYYLTFGLSEAAPPPYSGY